MTLCERSMEHDNDVYICFVDFEKAFDRVNWVKMFEILKDLHVDWIIQALAYSPVGISELTAETFSAVVYDVSVFQKIEVDIMKSEPGL